jgi:ATP-dependent Zn protease
LAKDKSQRNHKIMSPIPSTVGGVLERTATLLGRADSATTTTAASVDGGQQFAWPPGGKSLPFWIAIFIICPVIMVMVSWVVWECKYGSGGKEDVMKALRQKRKQANKKPVKITTAQISRLAPVKR